MEDINQKFDEMVDEEPLLFDSLEPVTQKSVKFIDTSGIQRVSSTGSKRRETLKKL
jgi:hypothetical protein